MNYAVIINSIANHAILLSLVALVLSLAISRVYGWRQSLPVLALSLGIIWGTALLQRTQFHHASGARRCRENLQAIAKVKARWAADRHRQSSDVPLEDDLFGPGKYLKQKPTCPLNGSYGLRSVAESPTCDHEMYY